MVKLSCGIRFHLQSSGRWGPSQPFHAESIAMHSPSTTMDADTHSELDKSGDRIRPMFAAIADRYDRMNHLLSMNVDRYWRWFTVRKVAPEGSLPILDVCTGTGDLAIAYLKKSAGKVSVVASDFCPEMLVHGRKKVPTAWQDKIRFEEADTTQLPYEDDAFQIVSVAFGLRNVSDTDRGIQEMKRVCAPGGRVAILEFSLPTRQPFKAFYGWYFKHVLPRIGQLLARNEQEAYAYLPASVGQFPYGNEMVARLERNGLVNVTCYPLTFGVASLYVGHKPTRDAPAEFETTPEQQDGTVTS